MTVSAQHGAPSLADAAKQLGVQAADMDEAFGVVPVDPDRGLYAVQVHAAKLPPQPSSPGQPFRGPWSKPAIAPFGPVQDAAPPRKPDK